MSLDLFRGQKPRTHLHPHGHHQHHQHNRDHRYNPEDDDEKNPNKPSCCACTEIIIILIVIIVLLLLHRASVLTRLIPNALLELPAEQILKVLLFVVEACGRLKTSRRRLASSSSSPKQGCE